MISDSQLLSRKPGSMMLLLGNLSAASFRSYGAQRDHREGEGGTRSTATTSLPPVTRRTLIPASYLEDSQRSHGPTAPHPHLLLTTNQSMYGSDHYPTTLLL